MRATVRLSFGRAEVTCHLQDGDASEAVDDARRWLDDRFTAYECEPLRPLGKVLTSDKLVALAQAIGAQAFEADETLRLKFAHAATALLGSTSVHIDVDARTVSF
jgi:hypothetical protein